MAQGPQIHPNVLFVPMFDCMSGNRHRRLGPCILTHTKVLCFSFVLFKFVRRHTYRALHITYYPEARALPRVVVTPTLASHPIAIFI
jgi:hypothetical protein